MQKNSNKLTSENKTLLKFSIRKVGSLTASVLIGVCLFGQAKQVKAADLNNQAPITSETKTSVTDNSSTEETVTNDSTNSLKQDSATTQNTVSIYDDTTPITSEHGRTVGEVSRELDKTNALGIAGGFHIFANEAHLNVDTNGNVAANTVEANVDNGSRGNSDNATKEDVYYIGDLTGNLNAGLGRTENNHVVLGDGVEYSIKDGQVYLEHDGQTTRMDHLDAEDVLKENGVKYINIEGELEKLSRKSDILSNQETSDGVKSDFSDQNNRYIDVTDAKVDGNHQVYVNLPSEYLEGPQPIKIKGLSSAKTAPTVVINVDKAADEKTINVQTQVKLTYDGNKEISNGESHDVPNELLWNFGTDLEELNFTSGSFMGSVLATNAKVTANVNVDGNIVADEVNISGGESHRWDLTPHNHVPFFPHYSFLVQPQPTQPTDPEQKSTPTVPQSSTPSPSTPEEPEQPSEEPNTPPTPTAPEQKSTPTAPQSSTPSPSTPEEPEQPSEEPDTPPIPVEPEQKSTPTAPQSSTPSPNKTEESEQPSEEPNTPPTPVKPEQKSTPTVPQISTPSSSTPEGPVQPSEEPNNPTNPIEPDQPTDSFVEISPKSEDEVPQEDDITPNNSESTVVNKYSEGKKDTPVAFNREDAPSLAKENKTRAILKKSVVVSKEKASNYKKESTTTLIKSEAKSVKKVAQPAIPNTTSELPQTGGKNSIVATIAGIFSAFAGSSMLFFRRKKENR